MEHDEIPLAASEVLKNKLLASQTTFDKPSNLMELANNTFSELTKSLEYEHNKLIELEERRQKLQDEMRMLKLQVEQAHQSLKSETLDTEIEQPTCPESVDEFTGQKIILENEKSDQLQNGAGGQIETEIEQWETGPTQEHVANSEDDTSTITTNSMH